jgi:hypothetical protein
MSIARFVARNKPMRIILFLHNKYVTLHIFARAGLLTAMRKGSLLSPDNNNHRLCQDK